MGATRQCGKTCLEDRLAMSRQTNSCASRFDIILSAIGVALNAWAQAPHLRKGAGPQLQSLSNLYARGATSDLRVKSQRFEEA